ncbi:MAG: lysophospholipid acyltransferase family protein [Rhodocyclaceae bacterium]|nr:lysophospholipid acyltransferase family protein [Rhodocyclaceae bacterium]
MNFCAVSLVSQGIARLITGLAWAITGAQARWLGCDPARTQRIYIANHSSHMDFVLLWASLPPGLRRHTRPVAAADYWGRSALRRYLIHRVFRGVLVDRSGEHEHGDPLAPILAALDAGDSLIMFPEGTRNMGETPLQPFRSGIYRLVLARPNVEVVPVWIRNLNRVMPRGRLIPLPLLCTLSFGEPLSLVPGEEKDAFLGRAREAVLYLGAS